MYNMRAMYIYFYCYCYCYCNVETQLPPGTGFQFRLGRAASTFTQRPPDPTSQLWQMVYMSGFSRGGLPVPARVSRVHRPRTDPPHAHRVDERGTPGRLFVFRAIPVKIEYIRPCFVRVCMSPESYNSVSVP